MKKINIRRAYYTFRHKYFTLNNVVIALAFVIAAGWVWGSLEAMQRNYGLQKEIDSRERQLQLAELETQNLELEKRYYQTNEYKELAVRERLGYGLPGESVLILPANTQAAKDANSSTQEVATAPVKMSNTQQWLNFLFGGSRRSLQ